ncbi:MAG: hypothetical protein ACR2NU_01860 [Aeoliella sp.]
MTTSLSPISEPLGEATFGFFTIIEDPVVGYLGGYLVVDRRGRPQEFHCTAPVKPSRAEEILFGPTLLPHLSCERIGAALLARASTQVDLVIVNQVDSWALADETQVPVVLLQPASTTDELLTDRSTESAQLDRIDPVLRQDAERRLQELSRSVELSEPFERIVEAIREAGQLERSEPAEEPTIEPSNVTGEVRIDDAA